MSNKVRQNLGISHGPYIDISLSKRGVGVGKFRLVYFLTLGPAPGGGGGGEVFGVGGC